MDIISEIKETSETFLNLSPRVRAQTESETEKPKVKGFIQGSQNFLVSRNYLPREARREPFPAPQSQSGGRRVSSPGKRTSAGDGAPLPALCAPWRTPGPSPSHRGWAPLINNREHFVSSFIGWAFPAHRALGTDAWGVSGSVRGPGSSKPHSGPWTTAPFRVPSLGPFPGTAQKLHLRGGPLCVPRRRHALRLGG